MKRNFNKEFKEEFKKSFDNGLNKDNLKENLNLVPQEDTIIFKKKPFYRLSSLFAALLIIVTASITFLVTYYADHNGDIFHCQSEDEDAIDFYKTIYHNATIELICEVETINNILVSLVKIDEDNITTLGLYFHRLSDENEIYDYTININNFSFTGKLLNNHQHYEYVMDYATNYFINFTIYRYEQELFSFCTEL